MNIYEKLAFIQANIRAPKNQYNSFGEYKYRSLEDISEAVKPLLSQLKVTLTISDEPVIVGDRIYIKSVAILTNTEDPTQAVINTAYAREALTKKKLDDSQITGSTSSYARKYCLNGLFCIDDNKDADSMAPETQNLKITDIQAKELSDLISKSGTDLAAFLKYAQSDTVANIQACKFGQLKSMLLAKSQKATS